MLELFTENPSWGWIALGIFFIVIELIFFSAVFIWLGIAAMITGLIASIFPSSWQIQVFTFSLLSLISFLAFKHFTKNQGKKEISEGYQLNKRATQYIGKTFEVSTEIKNGKGRVAVNDTSWKATGPDCKKGTKVIVKGVKGDRLDVEPA